MNFYTNKLNSVISQKINDRFPLCSIRCAYTAFETEYYQFEKLTDIPIRKVIEDYFKFNIEKIYISLRPFFKKNKSLFSNADYDFIEKLFNFLLTCYLDITIIYDNKNKEIHYKMEDYLPPNFNIPWDDFLIKAKDLGIDTDTIEIKTIFSNGYNPFEDIERQILILTRNKLNLSWEKVNFQVNVVKQSIIKQLENSEHNTFR